MNTMIYKKSPQTHDSKNNLIQWKRMQKPFHLKPGTGFYQFWNTQKDNKRIVICRYSVKPFEQFAA